MGFLRLDYLVDGTFNYKTNNWNYEYLGKW
jgi:hypothetical protein